MIQTFRLCFVYLPHARACREVYKEYSVPLYPLYPVKR
jgi:hypothetical protein